MDNPPGAAGNLAAELAVKATPDGYTLLGGGKGPVPRSTARPAPAATPKPIVEKLNAVITASLRTDAVRERLAAIGMDPAPMIAANNIRAE